MKKVIIFSAAAMVVFASCNNTPKAKHVELKTAIDSINYALGLANGDQIRQFYLQNDSTGKGIAAFFDGLAAGLNAPEFKIDKQNEGLANQIGGSLAAQEKDGLMGDSTLVVNYQLIRQGLLNGLDGSNIQMTAEQAQAYLNSTMQKRQEEQTTAKYKDNLEKGKNFLAENAKRPEVKTTESGLQYEVLTLGKGKLPVDTSNVEVNYKGTLIDGTVFDSNEGGASVSFPVNGVIRGWTEALKLMPVGSKYRLYIPQELAYGSRDTGSIPPFSTLIFDVELLSIK